MTINERLKSALSEMSVSQESVANEIKKRVATVNENLNKKTDKISIALVVAISKLTGYNKIWLIDGLGERYKKMDLIKKIEELENELREAKEISETRANLLRVAKERGFNI